MVMSKTNQTPLLLEMDPSKDEVEESTRHKWIKIVYHMSRVMGKRAVIAYANSKFSGEPALIRSLDRTYAVQ